MNLQSLYFFDNLKQFLNIPYYILIDFFQQTKTFLFSQNLQLLQLS